MALPTLPAEIHELIIDTIASWTRSDSQKALSTCALVCRSWHSFTLRHTFHAIRLPRDVETVSSLMERNPEIPRCIKSISVVFSMNGAMPAFNDGDFEQVCRLCTRVSYLSFGRAVPAHIDSRPLIRNGLFLLLKSSNLRHLTFCSSFKTSFLELVSFGHLTALSLDNVTEVILDHQDSSKLAKPLRKLKMWGSQPAIDIIHNTPGLYQLFELMHHFDVLVESGMLRSVVPWNPKLDWANCTKLDLSFGLLFTLDQHFFSYWEEFPWSSLSVLKKLTVVLVFAESPPSTRAPQADVNHYPGWISCSKSPLYLYGPSRLKFLETLVLKYYFGFRFKTEARVGQTLQELVHDCLDPTFRRGDAFPSLRRFGLGVDTAATSLEVLGDRASIEWLKMDLLERLPSIFGAGGRCEVDGWVARIGAVLH